MEKKIDKTLNGLKFHQYNYCQQKTDVITNATSSLNLRHTLPVSIHL